MSDKLDILNKSAIICEERIDSALTDLLVNNLNKETNFFYKLYLRLI